MSDDINAFVTVLYDCKACGEFEVIKTKSSFYQTCSSCGLRAFPLRIESVGVKIDGVWKVKKFEK